MDKVISTIIEKAWVEKKFANIYAPYIFGHSINVPY